MKDVLYGNYIVYQYEMDSEDNRTDKFFAIAVVLSKDLAKELCRNNDLRFYEEEEITIADNVVDSLGNDTNKSTPVKIEPFNTDKRCYSHTMVKGCSRR